ncbi:Testis-expressed sequence 38 protein [Sciurus carolinensis]|uniref:Testis-expressed sequence 38 protein n=1 Tax=Sciurus carolinensis TaxID=30640 RepID=A0AA41MCR8_SCICA|nr:Testis-expressed sequence 38 protein [Sciurus carolinensis]
MGRIVLCIHGAFCDNWRLHGSFFTGEKKLRREMRAQQWVEVMNAASFTYSPLLYWINKWRQYGINAAISIGPPAAVTDTEIKVQIPDSLWESDTSEGRGMPSEVAASGRVPCSSSTCSGGPTAAPIYFGCCSAGPDPRSQFPSFRRYPLLLAPHNLPPMLNHSASYPLAIYLKRNVHFYSLPTLAMG